MTGELMMLVWSVVLAFAIMLVHAVGLNLQIGPAKLAGNREGLPEATGWVGRAGRAHKNMLENIVLFTALVLVAHVTKTNNPMTLLGAQIFFWARVAHAIVYIIGIPYARTLAWMVSVAGMAIILLQLVK